MYLEKILCTGIFLFFAVVVANIATLVTVITLMKMQKDNNPSLILQKISTPD